MKTPITDRQVCEACRDYNTDRTGSAIDLLLLVRSNTDVATVNTAIARCVNRGLIEFDTTARTGWLTSAGMELIGEVPIGAVLPMLVDETE